VANRRRGRVASLDYPGPWEALRRTYVAMRRECARVMARYDLLYTEYRALTVCRAGPITPGFLAQDLGVTAAAATGIVARLSRHGWVRTRPHPYDRRAVWIELTAKGRGLETRSRRAWIARLVEFSADIPPADLAALARGMTAVEHAMRERAGAPPRRR
jgi:DNA-binding MarR family transcriptional regulator